MNEGRAGPGGRDRANLAAIWFLGVALGLSLLYWFLQGGQPRSGFWGTARGYTPAVAALIAAFAWRGVAGLAETGQRLRRWRVPGRLYVLAVLGPALVAGACILAMQLSGTPAALDPAVKVPRLIIVFFGMAIADGPLGEEIGWRGFLLPRLLDRVGPIAASAIVGVAWWLWHIPLYAADGRVLSVAFLTQYLVSVVAYSFVFTWFFLRTRGSALFAVLLHTTTNYFVYLASTLFPATRATTVDNRTYLALVALAGAAAAISLGRPRPGDGGKTSVA
jgi:uncharacterized protein